jgi:hypothetical protein
MSIILPENQLLDIIAEGLRKAEEAALQMAVHRPDVAQGWRMMAEAFSVNRMSIRKLAEEAATRTMKEKGSVIQ